ncbi:MAG TPA: M20/M25/M40 family metallo-hydrolase [Gemmatimonadaceae bacterium]|nr:M20/M25/M40 family metallo-hydrolase [Gemmatimonadaceae bacterium]
MPAVRTPITDLLAALAPARDRLAAMDDAIVATQVAITQVAAPTGHEARRAAWISERFRALGLVNVHQDAAGNVIARRPGRAELPPVVICSHLDTVFPAGTDLTVRRDGARLVAPGITDNSRGLAVLLAIGEVLDGRTLLTERPVEFVATVGEEGAGDLRGAKHYFAGEGRGAAAAIALDGAGDERIIHRALGARRVRVDIRGPGGHSWAAFGAPNAIHAAGFVVSRLAAIRLPAEPRATLSVGRIGGGLSINAIPEHAWLEVDTRSVNAAELDRIARELRAAVTTAIAEENGRRARHTAPLTCEVTSIGDRPCGQTPADHPLVGAAHAVTQALGIAPELATASTDANVPIGLGIPAIAIGAGGAGSDAHTTNEWYENTQGPRGVARALAIVVAAAGA